MHLALMQSWDRKLRRPRGPEVERPLWVDFSSEDDGQLYFVDGDLQVDLGIYLRAGDDIHPASHDAYEAELFAHEGALAVRVHRSTMRSETTQWLASDDGGRSWKEGPAPAWADATRRVDVMAAG